MAANTNTTMVYFHGQAPVLLVLPARAALRACRLEAAAAFVGDS